MPLRGKDAGPSATLEGLRACRGVKPYLRHEFLTGFELTMLNSFEMPEHVRMGAGCVHLPEARGRVVQGAKPSWSTPESRQEQRQLGGAEHGQPEIPAVWGAPANPLTLWVERREKFQLERLGDFQCLGGLLDAFLRLGSSKSCLKMECFVLFLVNNLKDLKSLNSPKKRLFRNDHCLFLSC